MNPYVFFVGCPRSGTTLVQRLGNAHRELAVINEAQWLPGWYERRAGLTREGLVTPELLGRLRAHPRFSRLEVAAGRIEALIDGRCAKHYSRFVTELFDLHGEAKGKRLVGEKSPNYVDHLPTLHSLWPQAKVVHLVRDGRDVALSLLDWKKGARMAGRFPTWEEDAVTTTALWWERHVRLGREAAGLLGRERYHELFYESLVAQPESECRRLCAFLGLSYDEAMLRFHEGRMKLKPGRGAKAAWLPVTRGLRSWEEQMPSPDLTRFEAVAGGLLAELGYRRAAISLPRAALRRAARIRAEFTDHALARRRRLPDAWSVAA